MKKCKIHVLRNNESAERTAIIYSLLGCCKLAGVNPTAWFTDVLNRLPDHSVPVDHSDNVLRVKK